MAYATVGELTAWLDPDPVPANAAQLLDRASRDVDRALLSAVYDTTLPANVAALRDATCEQVACNLNVGNRTGTGRANRQFAIGRLSVGADAVLNPADPAAPRKFGPLWEQAYTILQLAGLTGQGPDA